MPFPSLTRCALGLAAVVLAVGFFARSAHASAIISRPLYLGLDQGLVGYWSFEGKTVSGTRVFDASGTGNYGTMTNGPTLVNGKLGQALQFDSISQYVDAGSAASLDLDSSFSVGFWYKSRTFSLNAQIVSKTNSSSLWNFQFYEQLGPGTPSVRFAIYDGNQVPLVDAQNTLSDNTWHHIVGIRDVATDKLYLYVDGVLNGSATDTTTGSLPSAGDSLRFGQAVDLGGPKSFIGNLDDVRIYNRALSAAEIKRLYKIGATAKLGVVSNSTSLDQGLVGYWTFDGKDMAGNSTAGEYAFDVSGNGNRGTLTNGPKRVFGKIGQGMQFDGSDDYVLIPNNASLAPSQFTISVWVKRTGSWNTDYRGIFLAAQGNGFESGWLLHTQEGWRAQLRWGDGAAQDGAIVTGVLDLDRWYHIVGSYDGTTMRIYQDGVSYESDSTVTRVYSGTSDARIGTSFGMSSFLGLMDDVRLYNRALNADEIKRLYIIGAAGKLGVAANNDSLAKGLVGYWNFDGKTIAGTRVFDASGTGNYGTMTNGPTLAYGKIGQGMQFDGGDDYVNIPNAINPSTISISAWVYARGSGGSREVVSNSSDVWVLRWSETGGAPALGALRNSYE
jgi:hypothetical protein